MRMRRQHFQMLEGVNLHQFLSFENSIIGSLIHYSVEDYGFFTALFFGHHCCPLARVLAIVRHHRASLQPESLPSDISNS